MGLASLSVPRRSHGEPAGDRKQPLLRLALKYSLTAVLMLAIAFAGLEALVVIRAYLKYGADSPHQFVIDPATGLRVPKPGRNSNTVWINSLGFRSPDLTLPKPQGTVRVAFLGSSTTFCAEVSGNDATWPHLVRQQLEKRFPRAHFDYINAGVVGFTTDTSLKNLELRVKPLQPDVIVIYEGINDLAKDTRRIADSQGIPNGRLGQPEGLEKYSRAWNMAMTLIKLRQRSQSSATAAKIRLDDATLADQGYRARLERLVASAQRIAPVVAVTTISIKARRPQSPEQQQKAVEWSLYYMPYMTPTGIIAGFEHYNRQIRAVARQKNAILIDGEDSIPGDSEHFFDSVHFTNRGAQAMANRVTAGLAAAPAFQQMLQSAGRVEVTAR